MSYKRLFSLIGLKSPESTDEGREDAAAEYQKAQLNTAKKNYLVFQTYQDYRWPSWVRRITNPLSQEYRHFHLPLLSNTSGRDGIHLTNYISSNSIFIDTGGMISPSYASWSVEIWFMIDNVIYRPADNVKSLRLKRSSSEGTVRILWQTQEFTLEAEIFAGRTSADEAYIEIKSEPKVKSPCMVLLAFRPYSIECVGSLSRIEYSPDSGLISLDGRISAGIYPKPRFTLTSGDCTDVNPGENENVNSVKSSCGLASFCAAYPAEKGGAKVYCRIALSGSEELHKSKIDFDGVKANFSSNSAALSGRGFNVSLNDSLYHDWFYSLKNSIPGYRFRENSVNGLSDTDALQRCSSGVWALVRMGFMNEALSLFDFMLSGVDVKGAQRGVYSLTGSSLILKTAADIYTLSRNMDFINANIGVLSVIAGFMYETASKIKNAADLKKNTIDRSVVENGHMSDLIPVIAGADGYAYISRNLGLFGDEIKFTKLSESLQERLIEAAFSTESNDPFYCRYIFSGYPNRIKSLSGEKMKVLIKRIKHVYGDKNIFIKSAGVDVRAEVALAATEMLSGSLGGADKIYEIMKQRRDTFTLPDYSNPQSGSAVFSTGDSPLSSSLMFGVLRSMLFSDSEERLVLFPYPNEQWFRPGKKIIISGAPTRFGILNLTVSSQENDITISFDDLMKFIPPDIMINIPFKAKIIPADDFIIKKEDAQSFIINGWPSLLKFIKK